MHTTRAVKVDEAVDTSQQVTLVMPLYNTMARVDSSGRPLVKRMLDSVAAQESGSPQVLVLDNQSSDDTVDYVRATVPANVPLALTVDDQRRTAEESIFRLMQQVSSPYVAVINDDDELAPTYITDLFAVANRTQAALTYPNARWLGLDGRTAGSVVPVRSRSYGSFRSSERNLRLFLRYRNPVPLIFGLWRTEVAQDVFNVNMLDDHAYDLDNMILAMTFAKGLRVEFVNQHLFRYSVRQGHKAPPPAFNSNEPSIDVIRAVYGNWAHHIKFSTRLLGTLESRSGVGGDATPATATTISEELRLRLGRAFTWALGLAPATRAQLAQINELRRETHYRFAGTHPMRKLRRRESAIGQAELRSEMSRWGRLIHVVQRSPHSGPTDTQRKELVDDLGQFMSRLEVLAQ